MTALCSTSVGGAFEAGGRRRLVHGAQHVVLQLKDERMIEHGV
jgi:hypothetical protein